MRLVILELLSNPLLWGWGHSGDLTANFAPVVGNLTPRFVKFPVFPTPRGMKLTSALQLQIPNYYETIEISVLGHYLPSSIQNIKNSIDFVQLSVATKSSIRQILDNAARQCMTCLQKIFLARNCSDWSTEHLT